MVSQESQFTQYYNDLHVQEISVSMYEFWFFGHVPTIIKTCWKMVLFLIGISAVYIFFLLN